MNLSDTIDLAMSRLDVLVDRDGGGFWHGVTPNGTVKCSKLTRYNARVLLLLNNHLPPDVVRNTTDFLMQQIAKNSASKVAYSASDTTPARQGDIALLALALLSVSRADVAKQLIASLATQSLESFYSLEADQIPWVLEVMPSSALERYLFDERRMRNRKFGISYISFPALVYAVHYLTVTKQYRKALAVYKELHERFFLQSGEWVLSYFPAIRYLYRKAFSVHQLGMAPLYLLELYEVTGNNAILDVVESSIEYGRAFVRKDSIWRSRSNCEARSYEMAFDVAGLTKAREYFER